VALLPLMAAAARRSATKAHRRNALEAGMAGNLATMATMTRTGKAAGRGKAPLIAKNGPRMSSKRTGLLVRLLAVGAATGVAGALMSRRRIRAQRDEHESPAVDATTGDVPPVLDATKSPEGASLEMVAGRLASSEEAAETASSRTEAANDPASKQSKAAGKAGTGAEPPGVTLTFGEPKDKADQLAKGAATGSKASSRG
jgi:hypothetical protein